MMAKLEKVYELTLQLEKLLMVPVPAKERDSVINQLNDLIDERGKWMEQLSPPYTKEEQQLGEKIYQLNVGIEQKMHSLFQELKKEMVQMQKQKKSNEFYVNPYKALSTSDGTFLDRKN